MPCKDPEARRAYLARRKEHNRRMHQLWAEKNSSKRKIYMEEYRKEHREKIATRMRAYQIEKKEAIAAKAKETRLANLEDQRKRDREQSRARRAADPEKVRAQDRARRKAFPAQFHAKDMARRETNGEHIDALARARRKANPEPFRATDRKRGQTVGRKIQAQTAKRQRRALKANAPINDLTHAQWLEIQASQDHRCHYCGKRRKGHLTQDHITPLSKGGSHTLHNVIAACRECNSEKGTGDPLCPVQPLLLTTAPARKPKKAA